MVNRQFVKNNLNIKFCITLVGQVQHKPSFHFQREQTAICKTEKHDRKEQPDSDTADLPEQGKLSESTYFHRPTY